MRGLVRWSIAMEVSTQARRPASPLSAGQLILSRVLLATKLQTTSRLPTSPAARSRPVTCLYNHADVCHLLMLHFEGARSKVSNICSTRCGSDKDLMAAA